MMTTSHLRQLPLVLQRRQNHGHRRRRPANDKGLYALVPIHKVSTISTDYSSTGAHSLKNTPKSVRLHEPGLTGRQIRRQLHRRPHAHGTRVLDRLYNGFYPAMASARSSIPPAASSPGIAKTPASSSPCPARTIRLRPNLGLLESDGKWLVYSRARAEDPYPAGYKRSQYANDPNETQIQYDLYRIPFNDAKVASPNASSEPLKRHEQ